MLAALQEKIIFPGTDTQGRPESVVRPRRGEQLVRLEVEGGGRVVALFAAATHPDGTEDPLSKSRPIVIFFYGNAMCVAFATDLVERFRRLGVNVIVPDYPGYGMSDGKASEAGCRRAAEAVFDHLKTRGDVNASKVFAVGWSLGAAVAVNLATRRPVAGLAVLSGFTSAADMARRIVPLLPASMLLRHKFDSLEKIGRVTCPVLIAHGRGDSIIPFAMSDRLAAATRAPLARLAVDRGEHNEFFEQGGAALDASLADLFRKGEAP